MLNKIHNSLEDAAVILPDGWPLILGESDADVAAPCQDNHSQISSPEPVANPKQTFQIGVIVPSTITDDYIGAVVRSISKVVRDQGGTMVLNTQNLGHQDTLVALMLGPGRCDGIILIVPLNMRSVLSTCQKHKKPFVLIDYEDDNAVHEIPTVTVNNTLGADAIMQHLLALGHRRIGFITGLMRHASARERFEAYQCALHVAGLSYDPQMVVPGDWMPPMGYAAMQRLLALPDRPTAVMASNDLMALGAIEAAHEAGLIVGQDISITGFDDIPLAATSFPPLTTIQQPSNAMGAAAANMMIRILSGETLTEPHVQMEGAFIQRKSTGPL